MKFSMFPRGIFIRIMSELLTTKEGKIAPELGGITVPAGALIGGLTGGFGGAKLGEIAASGFYGRLDERQKRDVETFVYQHYGVSQ